MTKSAGCALAMLVGSVAACQQEPTASCPMPQLTEVSVVADTGWRARVVSETLEYPDTAQLRAAVRYVGGIVEQDRELLRESGAIIEYEFQGFPALAIRIAAADLRAFAAAVPEDRIQYIQIPAKTTLEGCG